MSAKPTVLVIGGTGTVGVHLLAELKGDRDKMRIVAAARSVARAEDLRADGFDTVHLDLDAPETLIPAMTGAETVFLLKPYSLDYLIQTKRAVDAAVKAGVRHLVNLGSHGAEDTPWAIIGWNRLVESYVKVAGLDYTHLRPNFFMDNLKARADPASGVMRHYFGSSAVSWIAAEDIAAVAAAVLREPAAHAGRIYPLAAEAASMDAVAAMASDICGHPWKAVSVPSDQALGQFLAAGWQEGFARPFVDYMDAIATGQVAEVADTFDTVENVAGRKPVTWRDFLARHRAAFTPSLQAAS